MSNPIKENRIVNDKTFAIRFRDFVKRTNCNDAMSEEEKEYLITVAEKLLKYQVQTATSEEELNYLNNIKHLI